jgi:hypothetical protein
LLFFFDQSLSLGCVADKLQVLKLVEIGQDLLTESFLGQELNFLLVLGFNSMDKVVELRSQNFKHQPRFNASLLQELLDKFLFSLLRQGQDTVGIERPMARQHIVRSPFLRAIPCIQDFSRGAAEETDALAMTNGFK